MLDRVPEGGTFKPPSCMSSPVLMWCLADLGTTEPPILTSIVAILCRRNMNKRDQKISKEHTRIHLEVAIAAIAFCSWYCRFGSGDLGACMFARRPSATSITVDSYHGSITFQTLVSEGTSRSSRFSVSMLFNASECPRELPCTWWTHKLT